jgi:UDP-N-acetylglucosamine acyltransferase
VTIHRALEEGRNTTVGNNNLLMVNTHLAHDVKVGDNAIFANNAMVGGHVVVEDRAFVSAAAACHQFIRIGRMAMVGGQAHLVKDVPPFVTVDGASSYVVGLNTIGLRRSGMTAAEIVEMKAAYRVIYRSGLKWNEVLDRLAKEFRDCAASHFYEFLRTTHRGITQERRMPPGATLKLRRMTEVEPADASEAPIRRAKAG